MNRVPSAIYEALPYIYILVGAWALGYLETGLAKFGGALLVVAGLVAFNLRMRHRSGAGEPARRLDAGVLRQTKADANGR